MTELLSVVAENLWLLLLVLTLLLCKGHRITGIAILACLVCFGFVRWFVILAVVIDIAFEWARWYSYGAFSQYKQGKGKSGSPRSRNYSEEEKR